MTRQALAIASVACLTAALLLGACKQAPAPPPAPEDSPDAEVQPVDPDDVEACAQCHQAVVEEWRESMHARAHHEDDPIYAGIRQLRMQKEGPEIARSCAVCHTPRFGGDLDAAAARPGVACAACHAVAAVKQSHDGFGANVLIAATDGMLPGPHDLEPGVAGNSHGTGPAPAHMKDGGKTLCLACHGELRGPTGVPICTTGPEAEEAPTEDGKTCVDCHMAEVPGPSGSVSANRKTHRSHRFAGPHRAWYQGDTSQLAESVSVAARFDAADLVVTLENRTGHGLPTGFPGRMALLVAKGFDAAGAEVWQGGGPKVAETVFRKEYVDAEGKPTLAPWAVKLASDSRLKPGETREVRLTVPEQVRRVEVAFLFRLLPPPLAKKIGLEGAPEDAPRVAAKVTLSRTSPASPAP